MVRNGRRLLLLLVAVHWIAVAGVVLTPLGQPYAAGGALDVKPQRLQILVRLSRLFACLFVVFFFPGADSSTTSRSFLWFVLSQHVERRFMRTDGQVGRRESGYWLLGWDRHAGDRRRLAPLLPADESHDVVDSGALAVDQARCHALPYCGLPYYFPYLNRIRYVGPAHPSSPSFSSSSSSSPPLWETFPACGSAFDQSSVGLSSSDVGVFGVGGRGRAASSGVETGCRSSFRFLHPTSCRFFSASLVGVRASAGAFFCLIQHSVNLMDRQPPCKFTLCGFHLVSPINLLQVDLLF